MARVLIDAERGEALLGTVRVAVAVLDSGLQVGGPSGAVLGSVSFGRRRELVRQAVESTQPHEALASSILEASILQAGAGDPTVLQVLALALAGADMEGAPSFEQVVRLAMESGWDEPAIEEAPAIELDRLAIDMVPTREQPWNRLVLASDDAQALASLRDDLAGELLNRNVAAERSDQSVDAEEAEGLKAARSESLKAPNRDDDRSGPPSFDTDPVASPVFTPSGSGFGRSRLQRPTTATRSRQQVAPALELRSARLVSASMPGGATERSAGADFVRGELRLATLTPYTPAAVAALVLDAAQGGPMLSEPLLAQGQTSVFAGVLSNRDVATSFDPAGQAPAPIQTVVPSHPATGVTDAPHAASGRTAYDDGTGFV
ncbi:MAG TPA: hypothetical protein VJB57_14715, partial [Dehalococcoidia bacterium]|nr:hypothetical protein [Dehalococcoidia bacterium]